MRIFYLAIIGILSSAIAANGQFDITRTQGISYGSIAGTGSSISGWRNGNNTDDNLSTAQNIGFTFTYKGLPYTQFSVSTNGFLTFNTGTAATGGGSTPYGWDNSAFTATTGALLSLAPFYDDLACQGNTMTAGGLVSAIKYQLDGSSPNRVATIEWINMQAPTSAAAILNFQVKLFESDNHIEYVYGSMQGFNGTTNYGYSYTLGVSGATMGVTPTVNELQTQQVENVQNFSNIPGNSLARIPECNSKYSFTPGSYSGAAAGPGIPSNDNPAGALTLADNSSPCASLCGTVYTSSQATSSSGITTCSAGTPGNADDDVWFKFIATTSNQLITVRGGSGYDAVVQLFSDQGITSLACSNATLGGATETINVTGLIVSNTYYIRVYHAGLGSSSAPTSGTVTAAAGMPDFSICVSEVVSPPSNDDPCGAQSLSVGSSCSSFSDNSLPSKTSFISATATTANGVTTPLCSGAGSVNDVWFIFVAPATGAMTATVTPVAGVNPAVQLYSIASGSCGTGNLVLNAISCTNAGSAGVAESPAYTGLTPGATYYLRVYQHPNGAGGAPVSNSQFSICLIANCPPPTGVNAQSITTTTAAINFTGGTGSNFVVEYGLPGFTPGTGATAGSGSSLVATGSSSPVSLSSLTAGTVYEVYVRNDCGSGSYSSNSAVFSFSTACNNSNLPVAEGFNTASSSAFPLCWSQQTVTGADIISFQTTATNPATTPFEGSRFVSWNSSTITAGNETRLVSPPVTTTGTANVDVEFEWMNDNNSSFNTGAYLVEGVQVQYSLDGSTWLNAGAFVPRHDATLTPGTNQWKKITINLPAGAGNQATIYVGFKFHSELGDNCSLDAVNVKASSSCTTPTAVNVGSVTTTTASASFTCTSCSGSYIVEYGLLGFTPGTDANPGTGGSIATGASSPIGLSGLSANTMYDVYVRQNCGAGNFSANSTLVTFTTPCDNQNLPLADGFNTVAPNIFPSCWSQQLVVGSGSLSFESSTSDPVTTPSEGSGFAFWNSHVIAAGNETRLVSPPITTTGSAGVDVEFQWFVENSASFNSGNYLNEGVQLQYSTDGTTWTNAGTFIPRYTNTVPTSTGQWKKQTITLPGAAANVPTLYVGFKFHSEAGDNCSIDDVQIKTSAPCQAPTDVTVLSTSPSTASVSFTATGNNFIVEYGAPGFTPGLAGSAGAGGTIMTGISSPISLSGLSSATSYDVYVRQVCDGPIYSSNTQVVQFTTICGPTNVPYLEDFELLTAPGLPGCTSVQNVNSDASTWTGYDGDATTASSGTKSLVYNYDFTTAADDWFFTRGLNLTGGVSYRLQFKYKASNGPGIVEKLEVKYGSTANASSMTSGTLFTNTNIDDNLQDPFLTGAVDFTPSSTGVYYIGFHAISDANKQFLYLDDVSVDATAPCAAPIGISVMATGANSATVSFSSPGNNFIVEYGAPDFTPGTGNMPGVGGTIVTGTSSPITISGLTGGPAYDVYVRQVCSGPSYGANTGVVRFLINDEAAGARLLTMGAACTGATETNVSSSLSAGEFNNISSKICSGRSQSPVWYKFVAPVSGAVRVSTDVGSGNSFDDSKIGLFAATDANDYSTFSIISCDDDGGSSLGAGFMSVLYATGLTAGQTYYVMVDRYDSTVGKGTFCIQVDELNNSMIAGTSDCNTLPSVVFSNGATNYKGWLPLVSLIDSKLIALVRNTNGVDPASYDDFRSNVNINPVRTDATSGQYYLDRSFMIHNTGSVGNSDVQLFFLANELTALHNVDSATLLSNLGVTRQTTTGAICQADFVTTNGTNSYLSQTGNGTSGDGLVKWVSITTPGFSNFYLHTSRVSLIAKVLLQGACPASGTITQHRPVTTVWANVLNTYALSQPYDSLGYDNYSGPAYGGKEHVLPGFFTANGTGTDIVDWILLVLRDGNPGTVIARRAAFVRVDGQIVDLDGVSPVSFRGVLAGSYYLDIRHRNHLGIRTPVTLALDGALGSSVSPLYDFTTSQNQAYQKSGVTTNPAMKALTGGLFGLWGGNANAKLSPTANTSIRASGPSTINDYIYLFTTVLAGNTGLGISNVYNTADVNMDGNIRASGPPTINDYIFFFTTVLQGNTGLGFTQHL